MRWDLLSNRATVGKNHRLLTTDPSWWRRMWDFGARHYSCYASRNGQGPKAFWFLVYLSIWLPWMKYLQITRGGILSGVTQRDSLLPFWVATTYEFQVIIMTDFDKNGKEMMIKWWLFKARSWNFHIKTLWTNTGLGIIQQLDSGGKNETKTFCGRVWNCNVNMKFLAEAAAATSTFEENVHCFLFADIELQLMFAASCDWDSHLWKQFKF